MSASSSGSLKRARPALGPLRRSSWWLCCSRHSQPSRRSRRRPLGIRHISGRVGGAGGHWPAAPPEANGGPSRRGMSERTGEQAALWLVQGPDVVSGKLLQALAIKSIQQVKQVAADTVVLRMTAEGAERLRAEFPELIIEANQTLR